VFVTFAAAARFRVLYKDDWDWIVPLLLHVRFSDYVFFVANEHIGVVPRALMWLDYRLSGVPGPLTWVVGLGCYLLTAATLVWYEFRRADLPLFAARAATGTTLSLLFFTYHLQVFLSPAGVTVPMAIALGIAAIVGMIHAGRRLERDTSAAWWLLVAACAAILGILSSGQGLATPFALAAVALAARAPRAVPVSIAFLAGALATVWLYAHAADVHLPATNAHAIARLMVFGLAYFGGPVSYSSVTAGALLGAATLATGLNEASVVARRGRTSSNCQLLCLGIVVFVLLNAGMTAMARAHLGAAQAAQSRYALFTMLYLSAVLALWTIRMSESAIGRRRIRIASAVALLLMTAALPIDLFVGAVWWAKTENARTAALALRVQVPDFEWIRTLYPDPARLYEWSRSGIGVDPIGSLLVGSDNGRPQPAALRSLPWCQGELHLQYFTVGRFFRMSGQLGVPPTALAARGGLLVVLEDNLGATRGLAQRAPIVSVPDPSYAQVIAAVWRLVRQRGRHKPEWFGFAQSGAGPPYHAFVMGEGRAVCAAPVVLDSVAPKAGDARLAAGGELRFQ
jgi:hypothetical protein